MIINLMTKEKYSSLEGEAYFSSPSLQEEGFIHCSSLDQVIKVANKHYKDIDPTLIVLLDEAKIEAKVVFEDLYGKGEDYPHVYGQINTSAIIGVHELERNEEGLFELPTSLK